MDSANPLLALVARKLALLCLAFKICLYADHLAGGLNIVADKLSRSKDADDDVALTAYFISTYTNQVPKNFRISALPNEISL